MTLGATTSAEDPEDPVSRTRGPLVSPHGHPKVIAITPPDLYMPDLLCE
jgi:hypothetical protein